MTEPPNETNAPEPRPGHEVNPQPPTDPRKQVLAHVRCADCNYDLFGHTANSTCPECGLPIQKTLATTNAAKPIGNIRRAVRVIQIHALLSTLLPCLPFALIFLFNQMVAYAFYPKTSGLTPCIVIFVLALPLSDPVLTIASTALMWRGAESPSQDLQVVPTPATRRWLIHALLVLAAVAIWQSPMPIVLAYVFFKLILVAEVLNQSMRCAARLHHPTLVGGITTTGSMAMVSLALIAAGLILGGSDATNELFAASFQIMRNGFMNPGMNGIGLCLLGAGICGLWFTALFASYFTTKVISIIKKQHP